MIGNDGGDRHDAAAQRLAQQVDVSRHVLVLAGERAAGASEPGLDLVGDEQHPMLAGQLAYPGQVARRRDPYAGLALDRLQQHGDDVVGDRVAERCQIPVRDGDEAGGVRAEMIMGQRVVGEADDRGGPAVEVAGRDDDLGLAVRHALDFR